VQIRAHHSKIENQTPIIENFSSSVNFRTCGKEFIDLVLQIPQLINGICLEDPEVCLPCILGFQNYALKKKTKL
jgi:hypothetical protein